MKTEIFPMVIGAALLHATGNTLLKGSTDRLTTVDVLSLLQLLMSLIFLPFCR